MAACIPFANNARDLDLVEEFHPEAHIIRCSLHNAAAIRSHPGGNRRLWIDPGVDGYHLLLQRRNDEDENRLGGLDKPLPKTDKGTVTRWIGLYESFLEGLPHFRCLARRSFLSHPDRNKVAEFASALLDRCAQLQPSWISVPQLPVLEGPGRHKINKQLAQAAGVWREESRFSGKMVLPLTFTKPSQYKGKTAWNPKLAVAEICSQYAGAEVVWVVDSSLQDQKGYGTFPERFHNLIRLHQDVRERFPNAAVVAGPYWGMNLVLWARELSTHPAVGLGSAYQYQLSGPLPKTAKVRLPLPPLRRWAEAGGKQLQKWLRDAIAGLSNDDRAREQFAYLHEHYTELQTRQIARKMVARFYSGWVRELEAVQPGGRALALYQQLSSAYVLGKDLRDLPEAGPSRDPAIVAQQLMLNCL